MENFSDAQIKDIVSKVIEKIKPEVVSLEKSEKGSSSSLPTTVRSELILSGTLMGSFNRVDEAISQASSSQQEWISLTLEKRKEIIDKIRISLRNQVRMLAEVAHDETGLGRVDHKINKNLLVINKTPGIEFLETMAWSGDHGLTIVERAPYGIIAAITPSTNPSETIINNGLGMISGGNCVIFNAHPSAKKVSCLTIDIMNRTIFENGGPKALLSCILNPTLETADQLMKDKRIRLLVVTGGPAVVKAAMNSGKKVIAGGPGNPPVVVDETADIALAGKSIVQGASLDNNIVCIAEKEVFSVDKITDQLKAEMVKNGAYEIKGFQLKLLEKTVLHDGHANKDTVGKDASYILGKMGIKTEQKVDLIICETDFDHPFVQNEMLTPVLPIVRVKDVHEGIAFAKQAEHNYGHTASMYSRNIENLDKMARIMNCSIFIKNAPTYAGLGLNGEGFTSFTIASPTGEGLTTVRDFTRVRRCTLANYFRIV